MKCERCARENRPGATYCAHCGARLPAAPAALPAVPRAGTQKVCPRCAAPAPVGARRCAACGYAFATLPAPGRRYWLTRLGALAAALLAVTALGAGGRALWGGRAAPQAPAAAATAPAVAPAASAAASAPGDAALERAVRATVQVLSPDPADPQSWVAGSGTVVDAGRGLILTNFHVVGDESTGRPYDPGGTALIALSPAGSAHPPEVRFQARIAAQDIALDLAVLRVVALADGGALPAALGLTALPVGDSSAVRIGDALTLLGYPGLGGETITLTRGTVAGFLEGWIKTDAETNHGNSGGAALNAAGELIGVPTAGNEDTEPGHLSGKIGLIRPAALAAELIAAAQEEVP